MVVLLLSKSFQQPKQPAAGACFAYRATADVARSLRLRQHTFTEGVAQLPSLAPVLLSPRQHQARMDGRTRPQNPKKQLSAELLYRSLYTVGDWAPTEHRMTSRNSSSYDA